MVRITIEFLTPDANETARFNRRRLLERIEKAMAQVEETPRFQPEEYAVNMTT
jgi:hypothetical protein